jgi:hypothetical protein
MEFERNVPPQDVGIDPMTRLAASTRQLTITPLHQEIYADTTSDEQLVLNHALQPAIQNIPTDIEETIAPTPQTNVQPTRATHLPIFIVVLCCGLCLGVSSIIVAVYRMINT